MVDSKSLLVLAASRYQLDIIITAKSMGLRVITVDNVPTNIGHALADASYNVDICDCHGVLKVAKKEGVSGILAAGTDVGVPTAAFVCRELGLPGPPSEAAQIVCDKIAFRRFLCAHGYPAPGWSELRQSSSFSEVDLPPPPWVIKPDKSSGSKGVFVCKDRDELRRFLPETFHWARDGRAIAESYIDGFQGTLEGFLWDGTLAFYVVTERLTANRPFCATRGHKVPPALSHKMIERLVERVANICKDLNMVNGPLDVDFVSTSQEVYILEMSPRLGGNSLSRLIKASCGVDLNQWAIMYAIGQKPSFPSAPYPHVPTAVLILGVGYPGRLYYSREAVERLKGAPWVRWLEMDYDIGAPVNQFRNGRDRVGELAIQAGSEEELACLTLKALREIDLRAL